MGSEKSAADYSVTVPVAAREEALHAAVPPTLAGLRLDQALAQLFPSFSRSRLQAWVKLERVTVDGAAAAPRDKVWGGEQIEIFPDLAREAPDQPQAIPVRVAFQDDALLVIDKPAGLVVHPGSGNRDGTLMNALLHLAPELSALPRAGIVHRLDKDTSGLMVVARTLAAHTSLVRQLQARSVSRQYAAVVAGVPRPAGTIDAPVGRHPVERTRMAVVSAGKPAVTHYRVLRSGAGWSLIECSLETGRTHQIRVHLASIGHPLIGDPVYLARGTARQLPAPARSFGRQALHAERLALDHPVSGERRTWHSALPGDLVALLQALEADGTAR